MHGKMVLVSVEYPLLFSCYSSFLGRAWRREFGEGTEWGRKGMFRVIGMEQFAASLVEAIDP